MRIRYVSIICAGIVSVGYIGSNYLTNSSDTNLPVSSVSVSDPVSADLDDSKYKISMLEKRLTRIEVMLTKLSNQKRSQNVPDTQLFDFESRLENLEIAQVKSSSWDDEDSQLQGAVDSFRAMKDVRHSNQKSSAVEEIEAAFDADSDLNSGARIDSENVVAAFDDVDGLEAGHAYCKERFCKLTYENNSADRGAGALAENELALLLAKQYGEDITIHHGEESDGEKTLYVERSSR